MIIASITKNGFDFSAHETARAAVSYIINDLGDDYAERIWASDDGEKIEGPGSTNFIVAIYPSESAAVVSLRDYDPEVMVVGLRALAEAIEHAQ